jgi:hypothetical protein
MGLFDKEEVVAPSVEAVVAVVVATPAVATPAVAPVAAPAKSGAECTRDTRGDAECAVKDCENCN